MSFHIELPCHGRGREFEFRRLRHFFTGRDTGNSNPQLNPQLLVQGRVQPHGCQEFTLGRPRFIAVFLRVQIERRLNLRHRDTQ